MIPVLTPGPPCVCTESSGYNLNSAEVDSRVEGAAASLQITLDTVAPPNLFNVHEPF